MNKTELTPKQYFENIKGLKNKILKSELEQYKVIQENLMKKATALGQDFQLQKLDFLNQVLEREIKLLDYGIDTFVYKEDILSYADKITDKSIKIIELKNYPREIPDEIAEAIVKLKKKKAFDEYFIIYTDYAEIDPELRDKINKERDPILFGAFCKTSGSQMTRSNILHNRFYYIADWEDEYCDLTLSKMVSEMSKEGKQIDFKLSIPTTMDDVKSKLESLTVDSDVVFRERHIPKKKSFFQKIKSIFGKK